MKKIIATGVSLCLLAFNLVAFAELPNVITPNFPGFQSNYVLSDSIIGETLTLVNDLCLASGIDAVGNPENKFCGSSNPGKVLGVDATSGKLTWINVGEGEGDQFWEERDTSYNQRHLFANTSGAVDAVDFEGHNIQLGGRDSGKAKYGITDSDGSGAQDGWVLTGDSARDAAAGGVQGNYWKDVNDLIGNVNQFWQATTGGIHYSGGNVGIGTTNPTSMLSVHGSMNADGDVWIGGYATVLGSLTTSSLTASANVTGLNVIAQGPVMAGTMTSTGNIITTGGKIGVGTSAPNAELDVVGKILASGNIKSSSGSIIATSGSISAISGNIGGASVSSASTVTAAGNITTTGTGQITSSGNINTLKNITIAGTGGIMMNSSNYPMITKGWDAFTSGSYTGVGRWGLFMEANTLTLGIPNTSNRRFKFKAFNGDSAGVDLVTIESNGNTMVTGSLTSTGAINSRGDVCAFYGSGSVKCLGDETGTGNVLANNQVYTVNGLVTPIRGGNSNAVGLLMKAPYPVDAGVKHPIPTPITCEDPAHDLMINCGSQSYSSLDVKLSNDSWSSDHTYLGFAAFAFIGTRLFDQIIPTLHGNIAADLYNAIMEAAPDIAYKMMLDVFSDMGYFEVIPSGRAMSNGGEISDQYSGIQAMRQYIGTILPDAFAQNSDVTWGYGDQSKQVCIVGVRNSLSDGYLFYGFARGVATCLRNVR